MKKFEYLKTVNSTIQELNELGSIGWELVSCNLKHLRFEETRYSKLEIIDLDTIYIFKKEING